MTRNGDWCQTYTGRQFWPLDPRPEDVRIEDIAHSLALQCRFAGHCRTFYSVAEHSVRVMRAMQQGGCQARATLLAGLLHDASEAYLVDLPRPLKHSGDLGAEYMRVERRVQRCILQWAGLPECDAVDMIVAMADNRLLATEARDLMASPPAPWRGLPEPLPDVIMPLSWQDAETLFLRECRQLAGVKG